MGPHPEHNWLLLVGAQMSGMVKMIENALESM